MSTSNEPMTNEESRFVRIVSNMVALASLSFVFGAIVSIISLVSGRELSILNQVYLALGAPAGWFVYRHVRAMLKQ